MCNFLRKALIFVSSAFVAASVFAGDVTIIANNDVSIDSLESKAVQEIFLGKKRKWEDGKKIVFCTSNNDDAHNSFLVNYVKKSDSQFKTYWKQIVFTGKGKFPKSLDGDAAVIEFVKSKPGAVGYVSSSATVAGVKTITVN